MMLRRRGVAWSTVIDGLGILWPTVFFALDLVRLVDVLDAKDID